MTAHERGTDLWREPPAGVRVDIKIEDTTGGDLMAAKSTNQKIKKVVDSFTTEAEAWDVAHGFAKILRIQGLTGEMGVTVKKRAPEAWWVVLVKRSNVSSA